MMLLPIFILHRANELIWLGRVGKTSVVLRYSQNQFNDKQVSTVQASYQTKRITVDNQRVNLSIWVRH